MIDHIGLNVKDIAAAKRFYLGALGPLGFGVVMEFPEAVGFGPAGKPAFWIVARPPVTAGAHVAFEAGTRKAVDAFHAAALDAGGRDNGLPGLRPQYHASYYGAFVLDPDGNNVEAVCHTPED